MKTKLLFFLFFFLGGIYAFGQNYPNIVNHSFNGIPAYGVKIRTNLPFQNSSQMPTIKIEGYNYAANTSAVSTINLNIAWYIYNNEFYVPTASSFGGTAPNVWLSNENGKVVIFLGQKIYYQRFTVSAFAQGMGEKAEYFQGWTVTDAALSGTSQKQVPYKNVFAGKVGIGTETPQSELDVNGGIKAGQINLDNEMVIGKQMPDRKNTNRLSLVPVNHTGGTWLFSSRDTPTNAFLDISYGANKLITLQHNFKVGILTDNPQYPLDVAGTIRATEVRVEITQGSDFVFEEDYNLKPLSEVEAFVKENKHLPEIPSEKQMQKDGLNMNEFQIKLLQKIEELTLYTINQEKRLNEQQSLIELQNKRIEHLENR
ncbi:hypothetical protein CLV62_10865 [Dysgonomonas alginatilytica]|uniref:Uncharacterized protein n=1 Tax=Dysgonomonas alginatilytica TaxID=1605892 RepID=A0A2V3PSC0_9BACT|nr:hypothetical protein [Dysgonomonas alginatilytica]PXV65067.1 hypothetical protein CLV62_10865 [Dysgonomonas alginatilytica]